MRVRLVIIAVLLALLAGAAWWWYRSEPHGSATTLLTLHGNVDIRQVQLAFNGSERIAEMRFQEGDAVGQGELLALLDTARLQYAVDQAAARVAAQEEVVAKLKAGSRPEEIRQLKADVEAARITADNAERTSTRLADLARQQMVSQDQADNARAVADAARASQRAATEALRLAEAGFRQEDIATGEATLKADQAQLALAERVLADARLYAPAEGIIQERLLEPGDMASPQRPVYTLALTNPLWVRAYVDEPDLGRVHPGMRASITTDSFTGKSYPGWVGFISPTAEFTPKSVETREVRTVLVYQIRIFVCDSENQLRLGMPATATIDLSQSAEPRAGESRSCEEGRW